MFFTFQTFFSSDGVYCYIRISVDYEQSMLIQLFRFTARALYKNVGCRWPGSLNFLLERPHVCQYICTIIRVRAPFNFLAISWCSISQAIRFEDERAGLPLRSSFREFDSAILAPLPSGSGHKGTVTQWLRAQRNSYPVSSTQESYKPIHG